MPAVAVAGGTWLAPSPRAKTQATTAVTLPNATYQKLTSWTEDEPGADGRPVTVVQLIEELADKWERDKGTPANQAEMH